MDPALADSIHLPIQWNCAEHDEFFSQDDQRRVQQRLTERDVENEFITYPGTQHGFATRSRGRSWKDPEGKGADDNTEEQQRRLRQNIIRFLKHHCYNTN